MQRIILKKVTSVNEMFKLKKWNDNAVNFLHRIQLHSSKGDRDIRFKFRLKTLYSLCSNVVGKIVPVFGRLISNGVKHKG